MTHDAWQRYFAEFMEQLRAELPASAEIVQNQVYFHVGLSSPYVKRAIEAATYLEIERGVNDTGLRGGTGKFGFETVLAWIDYAHSRGKGVIYDVQADWGREYAIATYLVNSTGRDGLGMDVGAYPDGWWNGWDTNLGAPLNNRYAWNGLFRRDFERGSVFVNQPDKPTVTVAPGGSWKRLDGSTVTSVSLPSRDGLVLLREGVAAPPPPRPCLPRPRPCLPPPAPCPSRARARAPASSPGSDARVAGRPGQWSAGIGLQRRDTGALRGQGGRRHSRDALLVGPARRRVVAGRSRCARHRRQGRDRVGGRVRVYLQDPHLDRRTELDPTGLGLTQQRGHEGHDLRAHDGALRADPGSDSRHRGTGSPSGRCTCTAVLRRPPRPAAPAVPVLPPAPTAPASGSTLADPACDDPPATAARQEAAVSSGSSRPPSGASAVVSLRRSGATGARCPSTAPPAASRQAARSRSAQLTGRMFEVGLMRPSRAVSDGRLTM